MQLQQSQKELLLEILHIIKYSENKEKFIKEFEILNYFEALASMLEKLPEQLRDTIRDTVMKGNIEAIKKHLSPDEYTKEVDKVADEAVTKFVRVISPVLTLDQKQKISKLLQS